MVGGLAGGRGFEAGRLLLLITEEDNGCHTALLLTVFFLHLSPPGQLLHQLQFASHLLSALTKQIEAERNSAFFVRFEEMKSFKTHSSVFGV